MFLRKCDKVFFELGKGETKMKSCEATGKSIEQAVQNALLELKAAREDVDIKILSEGGFLKKAKVLVTISEDAIEKYEKREKLKEKIKKEETDEDFAENFVKAKIAETEKEEPVKIEKKAEKEETKTVKKAEKKEVKEEKKTEKEEVKASKPKDKDESTEKRMPAEDFINSVLGALELEGTIEKVEEDRVVRYNVTGDNLNDLIGHHGDCMMALSYIMSLVCNNENKKKAVLDIENYRQKRAESLTALAKRTADKVAKSGRYFKFEPMEASERRILHLALQEDDRVTTLSKGEEPRRYLIVFPKEYKD